MDSTTTTHSATPYTMLIITTLISFTLLCPSINAISVGSLPDVIPDEIVCPPGLWPDLLQNVDGTLYLECHRIEHKDCEQLRQQAICYQNWYGRCPSMHYVNGIRKTRRGGFIQLADLHISKPHYMVKCCKHPIFNSEHFAGEVPMNLFAADEFDARVENGLQSNLLRYLANISPTTKRDHQNIIIGQLQCGDDTTTTKETTTRRPTTTPPRRSDKSEKMFRNRDRNGKPTSGSSSSSDGTSSGFSGGGGSSSGSSGGSGSSSGIIGGSVGSSGGAVGGSSGGSGGNTGGLFGGNTGGSSGGNGGSGGNSGGSSGGNGGGNGGSGGNSGGNGGEGLHLGWRNKADADIQAEIAKTWADKLGHSDGRIDTSGGPDTIEKADISSNPTPGHAWLAGGESCYHPDALVQTPSGHKPMHALEVGDKVLTYDNGFESVQYFLHQKHDVAAEFLSIRTDDGRNLRMTGRHLIPLVDCDTAISEDPEERYLIFAESAVFASRAMVDDCVLVRDAALNSTLTLPRITNITTEYGYGIYSPVTASGSLIVDGIATSAYSSLESHHIQHIFFSLIYRVVAGIHWMLNPWSVANEGEIPAGLLTALEFSELVLPISGEF